MEPKVKMKRPSKSKWTIQQKIIQALPVAGLIAFVAVLFYIQHYGLFKTPADLQAFIKQFGSFAVVVFLIVQAIQPVIPFLPGGIATIVGMLMFGNVAGILYSYLGLVVGEFALFFLIRRFGPRFARFVLSPKNYQKFETTLQAHTRDIKRLLIICFIFPFLPDDLVCLVAGMTDLSFKEYAKIILIFKLWSVAAYGYLVLFVIHQAPLLFH